MLARDDDEVRRAPVAQQREEVLEVVEQVVAAGEGDGEDDGEAGESPEYAGDACERTSELLAGEGGGVGIDYVAVDAAEHEEDQ